MHPIWACIQYSNLSTRLPIKSSTGDSGTFTERKRYKMGTCSAYTDLQDCQRHMLFVFLMFNEVRCEVSVLLLMLVDLLTVTV